MTFLDFIQHNLLLVAVAVASGGMLVWPFLRRATGGPWVTPAQATQLINREDATVLDVREPGEFGAGHVLGARNVPFAQLGSAGADLAKKRKAKPVIVYCETGNRSASAAAALRKQGLERVVNMAGGIKAWREAGLPVEK